MDLLWTIGGGSKWADNELRYSLRSVQKYLTNYDRVFIVGVKPPWLTNVIHVPFEDMLMFKEINIFKKLQHASQLPDLSEQFLFFNDDHFLLQPFDCNTFPYFYKNDLTDAIARKFGSGKYKRALIKTRDVLIARGHQTLNFDSHQPIIYEKAKIWQLGLEYDWNIDDGYVLKSLYGNTFRVTPTYEPDCKLNQPMTHEMIMAAIKCRKVFSIGDVILQPSPDNIKEALDHLYPEPSRWETN